MARPHPLFATEIDRACSAATHVILRRQKPELPPPKHASPKPTRDHPCCRRSRSAIDSVAEREIAKILTPHLILMRCPFYSKPRPASLPFFKDTSNRDMKSKPSTPRAPVPGIGPLCSGTQSPRHPHLAASCIGQRWSPVRGAKLLCQRIHALVRLLLTWVCGDCVVRLRWSRGFLPSCLGERRLSLRFGARVGVENIVW